MGLEWDTFWSLRPREFVLLQEGYWDRMELEDAFTSRIHATLDAFLVTWSNTHSDPNSQRLRIKQPEEYQIVAKIRNPRPRNKIITPAGAFSLEEIQQSRNRAQGLAQKMIEEKAKGRTA